MVIFFLSCMNPIRIGFPFLVLLAKTRNLYMDNSKIRELMKQIMKNKHKNDKANETNGVKYYI